MKTLEVTDEQYALVQQLREDIADQVVGKYGYVRERDVVQFMLDNLDGDLDFDGEFEASAAADGTAVAYDEGDDAIEPSETDDAGTPVDEAEPDGTDADEAGGGDGNDEDDEIADEDADGSDGDTEEGAADEEAADDGDGDEEGETDEETVEADDAEDTAEAADADDTVEDDGGAADDDEMLDAMMNLLETHGDKWEESSAADYRYSVELPDGTTEQVQTKDDVRALLFKNYR